MNRCQRLIACINHQDVDKIPLMYRALPAVSQEIFEYFNFIGDFNENMSKLIERLCLDNLMLSKRLIYKESAKNRNTSISSTYIVPEYTGPVDESIAEVRDPELSYTWGIGTKLKSTRTHEYIEYGAVNPMKEFTTIKEIEDYPNPKLNNFDLSDVKIIPNLKNEYLFGTGVLNYLFFLCCWLRGTEKFLIDMIAEPVIAEAIVNKVGEFAVRLNRKILEHIGSELDWYFIWDDVADTEGLMFSSKLWKKYFKKWYIALFEDAKKYNLMIFFHICGNINEILPDLIDIGVKIIDPIQTSARDMDLKTLKKRYGKNICFHGGIDVLKFLPNATVEEIKKYVSGAKKLFGNKGGLILGPSHVILPQTPIKNIIAIYED